MKASWKTIWGAAAVLAAGAAWAAGAGGPGRHGHGPGCAAEVLGLSAEQKATWQQLHEELRAALEPAHEQRQEDARKLHEALDAEQPDPAQIGRLMIAMHRQHKQAEQQHEALRARVRATLTPEQQVKFDAMRELCPHGGHGPQGFGPGFFMPGPRGPRCMDDPPCGASPRDSSF